MFTRGAACIRSKALPCRNLVLPTYSCTQSVFTAVFQPRANFSTEPSFAEQRKAARAKRRQKPGKVAATVPADQLHTPADTATFNLESRRLLQRVEKGLADMCELNEGMSVAQAPSGLIITIGGNYPGVYTLTVEKESCQIKMLSPFSGEYNYDYSCEEEAWISTRDQHRLDELVSRELVETAYLRGYPDL